MESHGGMISTGITEELGEKPVAVPLCPQLPHVLRRPRIQASAVTARRLTARVMARPQRCLHQWPPNCGVRGIGGARDVPCGCVKKTNHVGLAPT
jgi:hypothetical protein